MSVLAAGTYRYSRDNVVQPITEPWTLSRHEQGLRLQGERRHEGRALLRVDARFEGARCSRLKLEWLAGAPRIVEYALQGESVSWREGDAAGKSALPAGGLMFPLLRAATGPLVAALAQAPAFVVVPGILDPQAQHFLRPEVTPRRATFLGDRYQYFGGEYGDDGCECWLDAHGLLARYVWKTSQGEWDVQLDQLEAEPGFRFS